MTIEKESLPHDEKYHLYKVGRFPIKDGAYLWAHWGWQMRVKLDKACVPPPSENMMDVYASVKVSGPAYVKGSSNENSVWIDRVILVKPGEGKTVITMPGTSQKGKPYQ